MRDVVLVIHLILAATLVVLVLLQRSEGKLGAGFGGGGGGGASGGMGDLMTPRGTANFLTRATGICGGLFFVNSLLLAILLGQNTGPTLSEELDRAGAARSADDNGNGRASSGADETGSETSKPTVPTDD